MPQITLISCMSFCKRPFPQISQHLNEIFHARYPFQDEIFRKFSAFMKNEIICDTPPFGPFLETFWHQKAYRQLMGVNWCRRHFFWGHRQSGHWKLSQRMTQARQNVDTVGPRLTQHGDWDWGKETKEKILEPQSGWGWYETLRSLKQDQGDLWCWEKSSLGQQEEMTPVR